MLKNEPLVLLLKICFSKKFFRVELRYRLEVPVEMRLVKKQVVIRNLCQAFFFVLTRPKISLHQIDLL